MANQGKLTVIMGPMFASKSTTLIAKCRRLTLAGKKCVMVRHPLDNRYPGHDNTVVTHDGVQYEAITCPHTKWIKEVVTHLQEYDAIFVDEGQFYEDVDEVCDLLANKGKLVFCSGLYADVHRVPFPSMSRLVAMADDIIFQTAVDPLNGQDAPFTDLVASGDHNGHNDQIRVGGAEVYRPCSRASYRRASRNNNRVDEDHLSQKQKQQYNI